MRIKKHCCNSKHQEHYKRVQNCYWETHFSLVAILKVFSVQVFSSVSFWAFKREGSWQQAAWGELRCGCGRERSEVRIYCGKILLTSSMVDNSPSPSGILHISSTSRAQTQFTSPLHQILLSYHNVKQQPGGRAGEPKVACQVFEAGKRVWCCLFVGVATSAVVFFPMLTLLFDPLTIKWGETD